MYELRVRLHFAAAHRLRHYKGQCERLHGHNYHLEVGFGGQQLDGEGMLIDFREAKRIASEVVDRLDHRYLNELEPFDRVNPTTEHIARHVAQACQQRLPSGIRITRVTCWETDGCAVDYMPAQEEEPSRPREEDR